MKKLGDFQEFQDVLFKKEGKWMDKNIRWINHWQAIDGQQSQKENELIKQGQLEKERKRQDNMLEGRLGQIWISDGKLSEGKNDD